MDGLASSRKWGVRTPTELRNTFRFQQPETVTSSSRAKGLRKNFDPTAASALMS